MTDSYTGRCFCGTVEFEVAGAPAVMGFCHCDDCAAWSASPVTAFSLWPPDSVRVTKGADSLGAYSKSDASDRKFCLRCGGHLMTDHPVMGLIDVYPSVVSDLVHEPTLHVYYGMRSLSITDGLPKFKDLPTEIGGSGETLPE